MLLMPLLEPSPTTLPGVDSILGQYPILQFGVAIIVFVCSVVGTLLLKRGEKLGRDSLVEASTPPPINPAAPIQMFFDGPLKAIFESLQDIKGRQLVGRLEMKEDVSVLIANSRHTVLDRLQVIQIDINNTVMEAMRDFNTVAAERSRELNHNINNVHTRLDQVMTMLGEIKGGMGAHRTR
jgi:hypothetical protein